MSMARLVCPSRLELKSLAGSAREAPLKKVSFTTDLYVSPVQMTPSWDQVGVPACLLAFTHFDSSTTAGSASVMRARIRPSVSSLQSAIAAILSLGLGAALIPQSLKATRSNQHRGRSAA